MKGVHNDVEIAGTIFSVPTEQFFTERSSRLIRYFEKIIVRENRKKKITLRNS